MQTDVNRRVLVIDDNRSIHEDFRKILHAASPSHDDLDSTESILFGESKPSLNLQDFHVTSAYQGDEGLETIVQASGEGRPFAMAFVDVRMPPGMDGIETIEKAMDADPNLQFVICSAYSDYTVQDILRRLGVSDRLLLLRKPCDAAEILLLATAMCEKWNLANCVDLAAQ